MESEEAALEDSRDDHKTELRFTNGTGHQLAVESPDWRMTETVSMLH